MSFWLPRIEFLFVFIVALRVVLKDLSRPLVLEALEGRGVVTVGVPRLAGLVGLV